MKYNHRAKKDIDTRIHRMCLMARTNEEEMEELGSILLEIFHDVCRFNKEAADDVVADLCYQPDLCFSKDNDMLEMEEAVIRLENFVTDAKKDMYMRRIEGIQQTAWMLRVMDTLKYWVYNFGKYGPEYMDILSTCYMNKFDYTNAEACEILKMGESTLYRKKKKAVILFGLAFLEYKAHCFGTDTGSCDPDGMQIRMFI